MQHLPLFLALIFIFIAFGGIAFFIVRSGLEAKPDFEKRLQNLFLEETRQLGVSVDMPLDSVRYSQSPVYGQGYTLACWRILKVGDGDFYSFRASVREKVFGIEHSLVRVSARDVRRWLFWHPGAYKRAFGDQRRLRDLVSFGGADRSFFDRVRD